MPADFKSPSLMDEAGFLADLGKLDSPADGPVLGPMPPQDAGLKRVAVMWPEHVPALNAPPDRDGVTLVTAAAVILSCIVAGGVAALICRDAIAALFAR